MDNPLVSIVIPTHNRKDMVVRLLKSVLGSTYKNIEIIVVDDASTDGTYELTKKLFSRYAFIEIIHNKTNLFVSESRNIGKNAAKGKYIFFVDDDNTLDRYAIAKLVDVFEKDQSIGELGLVNYSYSDRNKVLWLYTGRNMATTKTYLPNKIQEFSGKTSWETVDVPNAFMIRADVLKRHVISFCGFFGIMYEESDLAYRIRQQGYTIQVVRDAKIYHDVDGFMSHFINNAKRVYVFARNRIIFHSLYSTKLQFIGIALFWIWAFAAFYILNIILYHGADATARQKMKLIISYLKGNFDGLAFVIRKEKLPYS